jgi:hypothetical protein
MHASFQRHYKMLAHGGSSGQNLGLPMQGFVTWLAKTRGGRRSLAALAFVAP